jgi:uncharacterized membrane protein SirB2
VLYSILKHIHVTTAVITAALFMLRLGLDAAGRRWRHTPLRWLPHANDTLLLAAAIGLMVVTGLYPLVQPWLTAKVVLLVIYILAGKQALNTGQPGVRRIGFAALALVVLALIFSHALIKPW